VVQQICKTEARKGPTAKSLLGLLIDIDDHDVRIDGNFPAHLEAIIEAAELEAVNRVKNRRRPLADTRVVIDRNGRECDDQADGERTLVPPPLPKNSGELLADKVCHAAVRTRCQNTEEI